MIYALVAVAAFVALIVVAANLMATVALIRTSGLTRFQKIAQAIIVLVLPFLSAFSVLHLIGQSDRAAIPEWIPDSAINRYVFELPGIEGKVAERAAEHIVERAIINSVSEHMSHSSGESRRQRTEGSGEKVVGTKHRQFEGAHNAPLWAVVRASLVIAALCAVVGCSLSGDKKDAEQMAEQYFAKMRGGDVEGVLPLYSARFYEATSRADWLAILESQRDRCGSLKNHALVSWNVFSTFGTNSGVRTTLVYDVQYSSCRMLEKMIIFKPSGGNIQIQGHLSTPKAGIQNDKRESQATLST